MRIRSGGRFNWACIPGIEAIDSISNSYFNQRMNLVTLGSIQQFHCLNISSQRKRLLGRIWVVWAILIGLQNIWSLFRCRLGFSRCGDSTFSRFQLHETRYSGKRNTQKFHKEKWPRDAAPKNEDERIWKNSTLFIHEIRCTIDRLNRPRPYFM